MGACIGKKSSKYSHRVPSQSNAIKAPETNIQNDNLQKKSSPSSSKRLQVTNDLTDNIDGEIRISKIDENSIDSELQMILNEQEIINEAFNQPFPSRVVSFTDTELEFELANLVYEQTENSGLENLFINTTTKCDHA